MPKKKEKLSQSRKNKKADASKATAGAGRPKIRVAGTHRVELEKIERFESKMPGMRGQDCVAVEFKVLETSAPEDVKLGNSYSWVGKLDMTFNGEDYPDFDRLDQLLVAIVESIEDGPSLDDAYDAFEDDTEVFAGVEVMCKTVPKTSESNRSYTLPIWFKVGEDAEEEAA